MMSLCVKLGKNSQGKSLKIPSTNDTIRLQSELGRAINQARQTAGTAIVDVAEKSGRVQDVIYRIEAGKDFVHRKA